MHNSQSATGGMDQGLQSLERNLLIAKTLGCNRLLPVAVSLSEYDYGS